MMAWFERFASRTAEWMGHAWAFIVATWLVLVWAISGPWFDYSDTWQLVINTSTTVLTFLMVFLIQNTQLRSDQAAQIKLDALILATPGAPNALVALEQAPFEELRQISAAQIAHRDVLDETLPSDERRKTS